MIRLLLIITVLAVAADPPIRLLPPEGSSEGRRGNARIMASDYDAAVAAYRSGLETAGGETRARLLNNLGTVFLLQEEYEDARRVLDQAIQASLTDDDRARAAYNAGNAAALSGDLEAALGFYRQALLLRPDYHEARFNYETVARTMSEQELPPPEDSEDEEGEDNDGGDEDQDDRDEQQESDNSDRQDDNGEQESDEGSEDPQESDEPSESDPSEDSSDAASDGESGDPSQNQGQEPADNGADIHPADAERILRAVEEDEQDVLRNVQRQRSQNRSHDRDW